MVEVVESKPSNFKPIYDSNESIKDKIYKIATEIYGADGVDYTKSCEKKIKEIEKNRFR